VIVPVKGVCVQTALPIECRDVTYVAGDAVVLGGISLSIEAGAPTVLIGPNGSGKTTLLRLLMGLAAPTSGQVLWAGSRSCPAARLAFMFQRPTMLRRSAADNVRYALRAAAPRRRAAEAQLIGELLTRVGLEGLADRPARRLSGGEQQRLALARALARDPEVLFLDEPTTSLDPASTKIVEDLLRSVAAGGVKVVMSTHDLGEARRLAGDVLMLHRGRLIERGPAAAFFGSPRSKEAAVFLAGELLL
jgi:tungstate transport system ATP-binding protein